MVTNMLVKKFVPRALMQQRENTSLIADLGEVALQVGYFFLNLGDVSTVASVNTERAELMNFIFYWKNKMKFHEQIVASKLIVAIQEALVRGEVYDIRGLGTKVMYSQLYGKSYQWVDIPDVRVIYKWIDKNIYDTKSKLIIKPSSSQLTKLQIHNYYLDELNQAVKSVGGFSLMNPILDENGMLNYDLVVSSYNSRLDFSTYDNMAVMLSNPHEFNGELKRNPAALALTSDLVLSKPDHILITSRTGLGKTQLALAIAAESGWLGNTIQYYLDPKHSDLATFGKFLGKGRYADTTEGINNTLHKLVKIMNKRYEVMQEMASKNPEKYVGQTANAYGFSNIMVIFDEVSAHLAADKSCLDDLKQLLMKSRQASISVVLILQDPRASNNLPSTIKDQTGVRIALGEPNGQIASLIFGNGFELPKVPRGIGQGFIQINGGVVQLFDAPEMPNNSKDLYELLKLSLCSQKLLDPLQHNE